MNICLLNYNWWLFFIFNALSYSFERALRSLISVSPEKRQVGLGWGRYYGITVLRYYGEWTNSIARSAKVK